ncbi:hypothetical protein K5549_017783, partial [Capra hircus]
SSQLVGAAVFVMGLEDRTKCWCYGPEPSHWAAGGRPPRGQHGPHSLCNPQGQGTNSALTWGGQDHTDGQILGQLRPLAEEEEEDGAALAPRPAFPGMGSEELRLASFYDWPLSAVVPPELLAAAGFFHTGQQDKVRCFFCYGGLQSWEQGDDPWTEHARWFPRCEFLLQTKGRDFVCRVQESCCCPPGSWDRSEEPEDVGPATPSDVGGGQGWPAWSQCPAVQAVLRMGFRPGQVQGLLQRKYHQMALTGMSTSQLVADLLQEEDGGRVVGARASTEGRGQGVGTVSQVPLAENREACRMQRSSCGAFERSGHAGCAWTAQWASSSCPAATWPVPSARPTCSSAPSAGPPSAAACAPSCP